MSAQSTYTLLLTNASYYIDQRSADRVREALRLDIKWFLMPAKVCGSDEPDRLVSIDTETILTLVAHDAERNPAVNEWRAAKRAKNVVSLNDYVARRLDVPASAAPLQQAQEA
jgi:hypothetical protein